MSQNKPTKHLLIVNGVQFKRDLSLDPEFITRLEKTLEIARYGKVDNIIVSGGFTRSKDQSEASFGETYLQKHISTPIFREEKSHTTIENIKFTKLILAEYIAHTTDTLEKITIVTTSRRLPRLKYLYKNLWPEAFNKIEFIEASHPQSIFLPIIETLYLIYSMFDINEKFLARFTKRILRNKEI